MLIRNRKGKHSIGPTDKTNPLYSGNSCFIQQTQAARSSFLDPPLPYYLILPHTSFFLLLRALSGTAASAFSPLSARVPGTTATRLHRPPGLGQPGRDTSSSLVVRPLWAVSCCSRTRPSSAPPASTLPSMLTDSGTTADESTGPLQDTRQSDRCNGGVFPAILNLPLLDSFVPSSHRPGHRRYPRRAFAMISCAPSGD